MPVEGEIDENGEVVVEDPGIPKEDVERLLSDQAEEFDTLMTEILDGIQKVVDEAIETEDATLAKDFVSTARQKLDRTGADDA